MASSDEQEIEEFDENKGNSMYKSSDLKFIFCDSV
jgi:hypothetical protein